MKAIVIGILASLFFAVTFILNRAMELSGGSWLWSSSLRFIFMVPFLCLIVIMRGTFTPLLLEMRKKPFYWIKWSFVGFVLFYAPITFAAAYGPGWLIAGTWQITIVAGALISFILCQTRYAGRSAARSPKDSPGFTWHFHDHPDWSGSDSASACRIAFWEDAAFQCAAGCHCGFCLSVRKQENARRIRRPA